MIQCLCFSSIIFHIFLSFFEMKGWEGHGWLRRNEMETETVKVHTGSRFSFSERLVRNVWPVSGRWRVGTSVFSLVTSSFRNRIILTVHFECETRTLLRENYWLHFKLLGCSFLWPFIMSSFCYFFKFDVLKKVHLAVKFQWWCFKWFEIPLHFKWNSNEFNEFNFLV